MFLAHTTRTAPAPTAPFFFCAHTHTGVTSPTAARPNEKLELRFMPPTAAAGQLQQRTSSPPPFRAGFHYERAQTPELAARKREQQRHAQHKAFTAAQTICYKPRQQQPPSAVAQGSAEEECRAPALAAGSSSSTRPQASSSQQLESRGGAKSSSSGSRNPSPPSNSGMQDATAQQPAQQANLQQQQPAQPQQQQQQPYVPGSNLASARGSTGASQFPHRHTRSSMSGAQGPPIHSPSNVCSPVIGSQGLLHAMAVGQGKQALDRWECLPSV